MSTWHQQKAMREGRARLWHDTEWTVVDDPPNDMTTLETFTTEQGARVRLEQLKEQGRHVYLLPPMFAPAGTGQACGAANDCARWKGHSGSHRNRQGVEWAPGYLNEEKDYRDVRGGHDCLEHQLMDDGTCGVCHERVLTKSGPGKGEV